MGNPSQGNTKIKESERRTATVLFADISGFTAMSERIDPEELTGIVNDCFAALGHVIERHGGTIDKFMGDCVMVLFGVPKAIENAPKRAIDCAIEMRGTLQEFIQAKGLEFPLDIHVGINTGEVIFGEIGSEQKRQQTVMGDTVNVASRLEDVSEQGQVVVGLSTYKAANTEFDFRELKPVLVRGKSEAVPVYEVMAAKPKGDEAHPLERTIHSDMIGRDPELSRLIELVDGVTRGEGAVVSVVGDAGIGKSRLVRELRASEAVKRVTLLEGRAQSLGQSQSFHLLADLIRHWAGIMEEDDDARGSEKLKRLVGEQAPRELVEIYPFLAVMLGIELSGRDRERIQGVESEGLSKLILKALRSLLVSASEARPVVIRLDDLHWSDQSSLELLFPLLRLAQRYRILFILVLRPNYPETSQRILESLRENFPEVHTSMVLVPLNEGESKTLVANLLQKRELPSRVLTQIVEKSEGNPFFIEEVVRSLIDEGAVDVRKSRFVITDRIDTVVIPDTINQVVLGRIDRLEEETRNLLKVASVIGRTFLYRVLAEVAGTVESIEDRVQHLKGIEILLERKSREEREYLFRQALAHEAVYNSILFQKRKELHLAVARVVERLFVERLSEFYGMLAFHFSQGEDLDKAEEYLINAGELALKTSASSEALNYYNRALSMYLHKSKGRTDPDKLAMLASNIATAYSNKGYYAEAVSHFDKALQYLGERPARTGLVGLLKVLLGVMTVARAVRKPRRRAKPAPSAEYNKIINLYFRRGWSLSMVDPQAFFFDSVDALKKLTRFDLARVENGPSIFGSACALFIFSGRFIDLARRILEYIERSVSARDDKLSLQLAYYGLLLGWFTGEWGHQYQEPLVDANLAVGDLQTVNYYLFAYGMVAVERGTFAEARLIIEKLKDIAEAYENEGSMNLYHEVSAKLLLKLGKPMEALASICECISLSQKLGTRPVLIYYLGMKARAEVMLGELAAAAETLKRGEELIREAGLLVPHHRMRFLLAKGLYELACLEKAVRSGERAAVRRHAGASKEAVNTAVALSGKVAADRVESLRLAARRLWLLGEKKEALSWFARSIRTAEALGARPELAASYKAVAEALAQDSGAPGQLDGLTAVRYREMAEALVQEFGAG